MTRHGTGTRRIWRLRWHPMRPDKIRAHPRPDRRYRRSVVITATCALGVILALTSDTWARSSGGRFGLASALQEATTALRRYRDYWRYGRVHVQRVDTIDEAERAFNQAISQERSKLSEELTTNIEGIRRQTPRRERPKTDEVGQYLVVTLIVATGYPELTEYPTPSLNDMEDTLQRLGTLLAADILGLEVIWSPENPDDAMTEDELLTEYP